MKIDFHDFFYETPMEVYQFGIKPSKEYLDWIEDDCDNLFAPDLIEWAYTEVEGDELDDSYYLLDEDSAESLMWWFDCQRMNEYQRKNCFGYDDRSEWQIFQDLTKGHFFN